MKVADVEFHVTDILISGILQPQTIYFNDTGPESTNRQTDRQPARQTDRQTTDKSIPP